MLVLTRKLGESIRIGDTIIVKIVDLDGRHVKLGIEAPKSIAVNREEIYERIQRENRAASALKEGSVQNIANALRQSSREPPGTPPTRRPFRRSHQLLPSYSCSRHQTGIAANSFAGACSLRSSALYIYWHILKRGLLYGNSRLARNSGVVSGTNDGNTGLCAHHGGSRRNRT